MIEAVKYTVYNFIKCIIHEIENTNAIFCSIYSRNNTWANPVISAIAGVSNFTKV